MQFCGTRSVTNVSAGTEDREGSDLRRELPQELLELGCALAAGVKSRREVKVRIERFTFVGSGILGKRQKSSGNECAS
jgi:hypothetical protein